MIANEGYIPLSYIYEDAYSRAYDQAEIFMEETVEHIGHLFLNRTHDILQSWLEEYIENNLYISDGVGPPIRMNPWVLKSRFHVDIYFYRQEKMFGVTESDIFDVSLKSRFGMAEPLPIEWLEKGEVEPEGWEAFKAEKIRDLGGTNVPIFVNSITKTIDLSLYKFVTNDGTPLSQSLGDDTTEYAKHLSRFENFSICVPEEIYASGWAEYWNAIGQRALARHAELLREMRGENNPVQTVGRPRKRDALAEHYRALFPGGNEGRSWKEVMNEIEKRFGISGSIDTLKRGLNIDR